MSQLVDASGAFDSSQYTCNLALHQPVSKEQSSYYAYTHLGLTDLNNTVDGSAIICSPVLLRQNGVDGQTPWLTVDLGTTIEVYGVNLTFGSYGNGYGMCTESGHIHMCRSVISYYQYNISHQEINCQHRPTVDFSPKRE